MKKAEDIIEEIQEFLNSVIDRYQEDYCLDISYNLDIYLESKNKSGYVS